MSQVVSSSWNYFASSIQAMIDALKGLGILESSHLAGTAPLTALIQIKNQILAGLEVKTLKERKVELSFRKRIKERIPTLKEIN